MPLFYAYYFLVQKAKDKEPREIVLYAPSEKEARKDYLKTFGVEAGKLIRRENW